MTWFTETPWPPVLILVAAGVAGAAVLYQRRRWPGALAAIAGCLVLGGAIWYVERLIVTPREMVRQSVLGITSAFQQRDADRMLQYISPHALDVIALVLFGSEQVEVENDMRVSDLQVQMTGQQTRSTARFRVNGTLVVNRDGFHWRGFEPTRWETKWQLEGGAWRMVAIQELDPMTGEELDRLNWLRRRMSGM